MHIQSRDNSPTRSLGLTNFKTSLCKLALDLNQRVGERVNVRLLMRRAHLDAQARVALWHNWKTKSNHEHAKF